MSIIATDLDGTIFKGQTLIDGVKEGLLKIINEGIEIYIQQIIVLKLLVK